jgi:ABC-2 type transport system permease protein
MFLVLFGGIFADESAPRADVIQVGPVAILDSIPPGERNGLDEVLNIEKNTDRTAALEKVRKGEVDAVAEQSGGELVLHYSAADTVKAATVQGLFNSLVQEANIAASGSPPTYRLDAQQVEDESLKTIQYVTPGLLGWAVATVPCSARR